MGQTPSLGGRAVEKKPGMEARWMRRAGEEKSGTKLVLTHLRSDWKEKMEIHGGELESLVSF